jgi:hypothetical protein
MDYPTIIAAVTFAVWLTGDRQTEALRQSSASSRLCALVFRGRVSTRLRLLRRSSIRD